jgi:hypothetical protein
VTISRVGIIARATNGQRGIGSGYDCEVLRDLRGALLACVTEVGRERRSWMAVWERGEWEGTEQQLADSCARFPCLGEGDWSEQNSEGCDALAERWDAARDEAYERRMGETGDEE